MYNEVIFDLETQRFFDEVSEPSQFGVSVISLYVRTLDENFNEIKGQMLSFFEEDVLKSFEYFKNADRIIGFNSKRFDVPVLKPYLPVEFQKYNHFDVLEHVKEINGKRVSLNAVAKETLGQQKVDEGGNAIIYWQKHDEESLRKLKYYCEEDVRITKEVYDYGFKNKILKFKDFWNDIKTIEVDFSYPVLEKPTEEQTSLF
ncbi:MAG: ribonuclease H-like domain-containing protein [Patescibacteria group bacterium]